VEKELQMKRRPTPQHRKIRLRQHLLPQKKFLVRPTSKGTMDKNENNVNAELMTKRRMHPQMRR
jgi:hypothetical protein